MAGPAGPAINGRNSCQEQAKRPESEDINEHNLRTQDLRPAHRGSHPGQPQQPRMPLPGGPGQAGKAGGYRAVGPEPGQRRQEGAAVITLYLIIAVALIAAGAVAGFLVVVSWGIHREEATYSITIHPPGRIAGGARVANGVHARFPGVIQEARYYQQDFPRSRRDRRVMPP